MKAKRTLIILFTFLIAIVVALSYFSYVYQAHEQSKGVKITGMAYSLSLSAYYTKFTAKNKTLQIYYYSDGKPIYPRGMQVLNVNNVILHFASFSILWKTSKNSPISSFWIASRTSGVLNVTLSSDLNASKISQGIRFGPFFLKILPSELPFVRSIRTEGHRAVISFALRPNVVIDPVLGVLSGNSTLNISVNGQIFQISGRFQVISGENATYQWSGEVPLGNTTVFIPKGYYVNFANLTINVPEHILAYEITNSANFTQYNVSVAIKLNESTQSLFKGPEYVGVKLSTSDVARYYVEGWNTTNCTMYVMIPVLPASSSIFMYIYPISSENPNYNHTAEYYLRWNASENYTLYFTVEQAGTSSISWNETGEYVLMSSYAGSESYVYLVPKISFPSEFVRVSIEYKAHWANGLDARSDAHGFAGVAGFNATGNRIFRFGADRYTYASASWNYFLALFQDGKRYTYGTIPSAFEAWWQNASLGLAHSTLYLYNNGTLAYSGPDDYPNELTKLGIGVFGLDPHDYLTLYLELKSVEIVPFSPDPPNVTFAGEYYGTYYYNYSKVLLEAYNSSFMAFRPVPSDLARIGPIVNGTTEIVVNASTTNAIILESYTEYLSPPNDVLRASFKLEDALGNALSQEVNVTLWNSSLKLVYGKNISVNGSATISIPLRYLPYGTYTLQLSTNGTWKGILELHVVYIPAPNVTVSYYSPSGPENSLSILITGEYPANYTITENGAVIKVAKWTSGISQEVPVTLKIGENKFSIKAQNRAGGISYYNFSIEGQMPQISSLKINPSPIYYLYDKNATIEAQISNVTKDTKYTLTVSLPWNQTKTFQGIVPLNGTLAWKITNLTGSPGIIEAKLTVSNGWSSATSVGTTIQNKAPVIEYLYLEPVGNYSLIITKILPNYPNCQLYIKIYTENGTLAYQTTRWLNTTLVKALEAKQLAFAIPFQVGIGHPYTVQLIAVANGVKGYKVTTVYIPPPTPTPKVIWHNTTRPETYVALYPFPSGAQLPPWAIEAFVFVGVVLTIFWGITSIANLYAKRRRGRK